MPKFNYTAIDQRGKQKTGNIDAASQDEARAKISSMGLMPTKVEQAQETTSSKSEKPRVQRAGRSGFRSAELSRKPSWPHLLDNWRPCSRQICPCSKRWK